MKKFLACIAVVAFAWAAPAIAAPFSMDITLDATNGVVSQNVAEAFQPVNLALWSYTTIAADTTVTLARVHNGWTNTLKAFVITSNATAAATAVLTNAPWLVPGDVLRVSTGVAGPTNATLELNGDQ